MYKIYQLFIIIQKNNLPTTFLVSPSFFLLPFPNQYIIYFTKKKNLSSFIPSHSSSQTNIYMLHEKKNTFISSFFPSFIHHFSGFLLNNELTKFFTVSLFFTFLLLLSVLSLSFSLIPASGCVAVLSSFGEAKRLNDDALFINSCCARGW